MVTEKQSNSLTGINPKTFLGEVAKEIRSKNGRQMHRVLVLMPNTRGTVYLRNAFVEQGRGESLILPTFLSMDSFVARLSPQRIVSPLESVFYLFRSFKSIRNPQETLSGFFSLGQILLSDFDEILRAGRSPGDVFGALKRWSETGIGFSDFMDDEQKESLRRFSILFEDKSSVTRARFIALWESLPSILGDFRKKLDGEGLQTSGMAYSRAAIDVRNATFMDTFDQVYFVGFGFLSQAEIQMMEAVAEKKETNFAWDVEDWYSGIPTHEVNRLFSRLRRHEVFENSIRLWQSKANQRNRPIVRSISCKGLAGMAQWLGSFLNGKGPDTALVVTDPGLVHALVNGLPGEEFPLNVTMGYPLAYTPWVRLLNRLIQWASRSSPVFNDDFSWLVEDELFANQYPEIIRNWKTIREKQHYFSEKELQGIFYYGPEWLWIREAGALISSFLTWLENLPDPVGVFERLSRENLIEVLKELKTSLALVPQDVCDFSSLSLILPSLLHRYSVDIQGSVSEGVQVMGLYESRLLDFKTVVFAPAEEGNLPSGQNGNTFLPDNIRKAFGLPLRSERVEDEVYQVYRLCHRAEKVVFLLGSDPGKRPGRVLEQIEYGRYFQFSKEEQRVGNAMVLASAIQKTKTPALLEAIGRYYSPDPQIPALHPLSPSSIHNLLNCPLRFFFKNISGYEEPDERSELEMNPLDFGNWVHLSVQSLLEQTAGGLPEILPSHYETMKRDWERVSQGTWENLKGKTSTGPLQSFAAEKEIGRVMAYRFFDALKKMPSHRWRANERPFDPQILEDQGRVWWISGRVDIVLETDDRFFLVDLKTGAFQAQNNLLIKPERSILPENALLNHKDFFQMVLYNRLAAGDGYYRGKKARAVLFYLASPDEPWVDPFEKVDAAGREEDVYAALDEFILGHLQQLADPEIPVLQTDKRVRCATCSFSGICQRA